MKTEDYSKDDCLNALRKSQEILGKSPTRREYEELNIEPSASILRNRFGRWNKAKLEAGLEVSHGGRPAKPVDEDYFESIDTPTKAYWLGLLFGDGSLMHRKYGYRVQLTLHLKDEPHLRKFKQTVNAENKIVEDENVLHLRIGNKAFAKNLIEHGFTKTKGTDGSLPQLESWKKKRSFIRGLADADGYFGEYKWTITDNTSKRLKKLKSWIPIETEIIEEDIDGRSWSYLRVGGRDNLRVLYSWLFPRGTHTKPALSRKKDDALEALSTFMEEYDF